MLMERLRAYYAIAQRDDESVGQFKRRLLKAKREVGQSLTEDLNLAFQFHWNLKDEFRGRVSSDDFSFDAVCAAAEKEEDRRAMKLQCRSEVPEKSVVQSPRARSLSKGKRGGGSPRRNAARRKSPENIPKRRCFNCGSDQHLSAHCPSQRPYVPPPRRPVNQMQNAPSHSVGWYHAGEMAQQPPAVVLYNEATPSVAKVRPEKKQLVPAAGFIFDGLPKVALDLKPRSRRGKVKALVAILDTGATNTVVSGRVVSALRQNGHDDRYDNSQCFELHGANGTSQSCGSVSLSGVQLSSSDDPVPFAVKAAVSPDLPVDILIGSDVLGQVGCQLVSSSGQQFWATSVPKQFGVRRSVGPWQNRPRRSTSPWMRNGASQGQFPQFGSVWPQSTSHGPMFGLRGPEGGGNDSHGYSSCCVQCGERVRSQQQ